jgi:hypothetical protein
MRIPPVAPILLVVWLAAPRFADGAVVWNEVGDAGPLLGTAQTVTGSGPLTNIVGTISSENDVDLYRFVITHAGTFSASLHSNGGGAANFDAQLWLFDAGGIGVAADDDTNGTDGGLLTAAFVANPGIYYIGVTAWNNDPVSAGGLIFPDVVFPGSLIESANTGPGGASPLLDWNNPAPFPGGNYNIALSAAAPVPEPTAIAIWSLLGGVGILAANHRRSSRLV